MDLSKLSSPLVFFHGGCTDGWCAAWLASLRFPGAELVPVSYTEPPPWPAVTVHGRDVLVLDFSWKRAIVTELAAKARSLLILDHHATAAKELEGLDFAVFDMNRSGAGLALDTFFPEARRPAEVFIDTFMRDFVPGAPIDGMIVTPTNHPGGTIEHSARALYAEDRDLWKWDLPRSREYSAGLSVLPQTPEAWNGRHSLHGTAEQGRAILAYQTQQVERVIKHAHRAFLSEGEVLVVNTPVLQSSCGTRTRRGKRSTASARLPMAQTWEPWQRPAGAGVTRTRQGSLRSSSTTRGGLSWNASRH